MPIKVLWVSRHTILAVQRSALKTIFGPDVEIVPDARPFDSAEKIAERFRTGGYDDLAIVAPLTVVKSLTEAGVQPLLSVSKKRNGKMKFIEFKRVTDVQIKYAATLERRNL